jgi:uncharacterized protein (DUF1330 family)
MTAYMIAEVQFIPGPALQTYRERAGSSITLYGGRFVVRGQQRVPVEGGTSELNQIIVVEFPSLPQAWLWYNSPEYRAARELVAEAMHRKMYFVEGVM